MKVNPYLFFNGRCEEAINFYKKALGAEVIMLMRHKDSPDKPPPGAVAPGMDEKILHASLRIGESDVMASDGHGSGALDFKGFSLPIAVTSEAEAERIFKALSDGGEVRMPLAKTFFSPKFGMVADKFGVSWMVLTTPKE
jgi:PhnB protein